MPTKITSFSAAIALLLICALGCQQPTPDQSAGLQLFQQNIQHPATATLTDAEIQTTLNDNASPDGESDGLVFGVVDDHGPRVFAAGTFGDGTGRKVDGNTAFRIASITKVFTAILLQDMVDRGEMKLDDPVQKYLPASVKMPTHNGKQITLFDLATHTSGLPRDGDGGDAEHLYAFLSRCQLNRDPGAKWEYSNLGVGLLGHVISLKARKSYESLVIDRICNPLGMNSTRITRIPELRARSARPNAFPGFPLSDGDWHGPLEGCGALRSTANDLLKFVSANLGLTSTPITPLLQRTYAVHQLPSGRTGRLVWYEESGFICHGGSVPGFVSDIGFDLVHRRGIVSLTNCSNCRMRWMWKPFLSRSSGKPPQVVSLDPALLENYIGTYQHGDETCIVRRDGNRLTFQWWNGRPWYSLPNIRMEGYSQSASVFSNQLWGAGPALFDLDASGRTVRYSIVFEGKTLVWQKTSNQPPPQTRAPIHLANVQGYVGQYRHFLLGLIPVGPTFNARVINDESGAHLIGYTTASEQTEFFPINENTLITPDLDDAWVTLVPATSSAGKPHLIVHYNGDDIRVSQISNHPG